ncbi:CAP-Gly domain-containing linker protein 1-like [Cebidichthys violaceus]|uniref:CAP-Gly domain-containing linker protein 1-like n=1 Tax=Cebidichthys violaceus TaxID=271503 RepID=UPI0035C9BCB8
MDSTENKQMRKQRRQLKVQQRVKQRKIEMNSMKCEPPLKSAEAIEHHEPPVQLKQTTKEDLEAVQHQQKMEIEKLQITLLAAQQQLNTESDHWDQEKASLVLTNTSNVAQVEQQKMENGKLQNTLKATKQQLNTEFDQLHNSLSKNVEKYTRQNKKFALECVQWEQEKASLVLARASSELTRAPGKAQVEQQEELNILKNKLVQAQAKYLVERDQWKQSKASLLKDQLDKQKLENQELHTALKVTKQELTTEREQSKTARLTQLEMQKKEDKKLADEQDQLKASLLKETMELVGKKTRKTQKVETALKETEQELNTERGQWQKDSLSDLKKQKKHDKKHAAARNQWEQEKASLELIRDSCLAELEQQKMEDEKLHTAQMFERDQTSQAQLEEERAETNRIKAALKQTENLLERERLRFEEQSSLTAHLEKTCMDLNHAQLKDIATLQTLEEEATQMFERDQTSQAQLEEQRVEINRIKADQKKTEDLLETERLLWQQEKSSLEATEKDLLSQIINKQKKKKKWYHKLFKRLFPCFSAED